ncbi:MAG: hypothetical protein Q7U57_07475 [Methylovulum sp.]|nr:hypothetical protein [Methylovulum sp.]
MRRRFFIGTKVIVLWRMQEQALVVLVDPARLRGWTNTGMPQLCSDRP